MVYKTCGDTIAVRLEKGEEIVSSIRAICEKEGVKAGTIQGDRKSTRLNSSHWW